MRTTAKSSKIIGVLGSLFVVLFIGLSISVAAQYNSKDQERGFTTIEAEHPHPWNHLNFPDQSKFFQFAIVGDRGGGSRPGVFKTALDHLTALKPSFVMSVGDLLDTRDIQTDPDWYDEKNVGDMWIEFNKMVEDLPIPFFYVVGNNDIRNILMEKKWHQVFGRTYYHFLYQDVLFVILNSDDPPDKNGAFSKVQLDWLRNTLSENSKVRWTFIFLHRPLWLNPNQPGWMRVERLLKNRPRTVFAGHHHRYTKSIVRGHAYYGLATTGGRSALSGITSGEFDHVVWVTITDEGPRIMNLMLKGIWGDDPAIERRN
jgi:hypothetical protein